MMKNIKSGDLRIKSIDKYSFCLSDIIGQGCSSKVYKGINQHTNQTVAIKVINIASLHNQLKLQLVKNQIKVLQKINHQNVIKCHEVFTSSNNFYIVMELCQEGNLQSILSRKGRLSQKQGLIYIRKILNGYLHLRQVGILHRDLKPSNIFIKQGQLKIGDFGFAQFQNIAKNDNYKVGSPLYMAPQILQNYEYSTEADIWSLGVMFYQIFQGLSPWEGNTQQQLIRSRMQGFRFKVTLKRQLQILIARCLQYRKQDRISIQQMLEKVQGLIDSDKQNHNTYNTKSIIEDGCEKANTIINDCQKENTIINDCQKANIIKQSNKFTQASRTFTQNSEIHHNQLILKTGINLARFTFKITKKIQNLQIRSDDITKISKKLSEILQFLITNLYMCYQTEQAQKILNLKNFCKHKNNQFFQKIYIVISEYWVRYSQFFTETRFFLNNACIFSSLQLILQSLIKYIVQIPILNSHLLFRAIYKQNNISQCYHNHNIVYDNLISLSSFLLIAKNQGYEALQTNYGIDLSQIIKNQRGFLKIQDLKELQDKKKFLEDFLSFKLKQQTEIKLQSISI